MSGIRSIRDVAGGLLALALVLLPLSAGAGIINVPADQATLLAAVGAAVSGDEIVVQPGTYTETAALIFNQSNVTMRAASGTVIVRGPSSANSIIVIGSNRTTITLQGIQVERPTADQTWMRCVELGQQSQANFVQCNFRGNANGVGVILFNSADANFTTCTFQNFNNSTSWAGAVSFEGTSGSDFSDATIDGCTFTTGCNKWIASTNVARVGRLTVKNSTFNGSNASQPIYFHTNTPYSNTRPILFENNTFTGNLMEITEFHYTNAGGPQSLTFRRCRYEPYNGTRRLMYLDVPTVVTFEDVLVKGGVFQTLLRIWGGPSAVNFYNCTFVTDGASAAQGSGGVAGSTFIDGWDGGRHFQVRNCIFHTTANYTAGFVGDAGSTNGGRIYDMDYTIVSHPTPVGSLATINAGTNYFTTTPIFVNEAGRDYNLAGGSPGLGEGIDLGYALDAVGGMRPNPVGSIPDIGALESWMVPVELSTFALE